jgi:hypothetical protein
MRVPGRTGFAENSLAASWPVEDIAGAGAPATAEAEPPINGMVFHGMIVLLKL